LINFNNEKEIMNSYCIPFTPINGGNVLTGQDVDAVLFAKRLTRNSSFVAIVIDGVTNIAGSAFRRCINLRSIELSEDLVNIGEGAFFYCGNLQSIELPEDLVSISTYVFMECRNLRSIELPKSLVSIGNYAFAFCASLQSVFFKGNSKTTPPTIGVGAFSNINSDCEFYVPNDSYIKPLLNSNSGINEDNIIIGKP